MKKLTKKRKRHLDRKSRRKPETVRERRRRTIRNEQKGWR